MSESHPGFIYDPKYIRNFSIIAHIDHGKSTIADRLLEMTQTISKRDMQEQLLDAMDLERERGITIKAHPVTMYYKAADGQTYQINFIDTPGHVDFNYEVSRSLSACEGALLVVDAAQGVQAQSLANVYLAVERNLEIVPVLNKIDLPAADPDNVKQQIEDLIGLDCSEAILCSAKTGLGVDGLLEEIVKKFPPPKPLDSDKLSCLVFDSHYDTYRGVLVYIRVFSGEIRAGQRIKMMATDQVFEVMEVGIFSPKEKKCAVLRPGEVGYLVANIKSPHEVKIGDTITGDRNSLAEPLPGFKVIKPVVFAGIYPVDTNDLQLLKESFERLRLNDSALTVEVESTSALGFGFRCGFLGLLHLEIVFERLRREFDLDIITTAPSVTYRFQLKNGTEMMINNVAHYPDPSTIAKTEEPWSLCHIMFPNQYMGKIMNLIQDKRGILTKSDDISQTRTMITCRFPLNEIITEFSDTLKSITSGYASFDYEFDSYEPSEIVKLEIRVHEEPVDTFSCLIHKSKAMSKGKELCKRLAEEIPRHQFKIAIQAAIGGNIIARETISSLSKNVTAKCYGGDITRKRKLWEKQRKGKEKMKMFGQVSVPSEAYIAIFKTSPDS